MSEQKPPPPSAQPSVIIDLSKGIKQDKPVASNEAEVCARGAGGHAACLGAPQPPHPPVSGRVLLGGASKLTYPVGKEGESEQQELASRPSAANWGQWSSTD